MRMWIFLLAAEGLLEATCRPTMQDSDDVTTVQTTKWHIEKRNFR